MAISIDLNSLQGKITGAFFALVIITLVLGVIAYFDLLFLERQVNEGEVVKDLQDKVLEMRREEKNLFLYGDQSALIMADKNAALSLDILERYSDVIGTITGDAERSKMTGDLHAYRNRLERWKVMRNGKRDQLQGDIRVIGHRIYLSVESMFRQERRMLETTVQKSQWVLLTSLFLIGLSIFILGHRFKRAIILPLKQLESRLMPIAKGHFKRLEPPSDDREFVTFVDAFNRMLKELEIRQKRMLQSEKLASLGILASGVAHELNNPLSNISSSCQLLMEELHEADPQQLNIWLKQIDGETERGRNIVRTLLDFGSQRNFQTQNINLLDLINETRVILGKTLQQDNATLTLNIPDDIRLNLDKQRMQQLFINLIQNASNAAGNGAQLRISAMLRDRGVSMIPDNAEVAGNLKCLSGHDGRYVEILVSDDGPGISRDNLSKVFDPFFTTSEPGRGVGLGLFIVQEIVREHDGCLAITSRPDQGTKVIILLPEEKLENDQE